jgi:hypothetical protein
MANEEQDTQANRAESPSPAQEWRPIETAPKKPLKDGFGSCYGPRILAYPVGGMVAGACWFESKGKNGTTGFVADWQLECKPTHWMPLPSPPKENQ